MSESNSAGSEMNDSTDERSTRITHNSKDRDLCGSIDTDSKNKVVEWFLTTWNINYGATNKLTSNDRLSRKDPYAICCMLTTAQNSNNEAVLAHAASRLDELYKTKIFYAISYKALCSLVVHSENTFSLIQNIIAIARWCRWIPGRKSLAPSLRNLLHDKGLTLGQRIALNVVEIRYRDLFG